MSVISFFGLLIAIVISAFCAGFGLLLGVAAAFVLLDSVGRKTNGTSGNPDHRSGPDHMVLSVVREEDLEYTKAIPAVPKKTRTTRKPVESEGNKSE